MQYYVKHHHVLLQHSQVKSTAMKCCCLLSPCTKQAAVQLSRRALNILALADKHNGDAEGRGGRA